MGIIAWIILGLDAGLIANMLIPGQEITRAHPDLPDRGRRRTSAGRAETRPP
jgi:hypothetical protein